MNNIIYESCVRYKCYYIDAMTATLDLNTGERNPRLFKNGKNIHPNGRGYGVLAKMYIRIIHGRRFNPVGY